MNRFVRLLNRGAIMAQIVLVLFSAACGAARSAVETPTLALRLSATPIPATATPAVEIPTLTPTATEAVVVGPQRPELTDGTGARYNATQKYQIEAGAFAEQERVLAAFYQYWAGAASSPLYPPRPGEALYFVYVFNPTDAGDACVAIPALGHGLQLAAVPYVNGEPARAAPSRYVNGGIETGQGPLLMAKGGTSESPEGGAFVLGCEGGMWVRRDAANPGQVTERINQQNQWQVELARIAQNHGLNSERQYAEQTVDGARYLVDQFNGAKMLVWENGAWADTSLEVKYGHLVPENEGIHIRNMWGNRFFDTTCSNADMNDHRYEYVEMGVRPTGNFRVETAVLPGMDMETVNIYGGVVFRDNNHTLRYLDVRFDVIDPNQEIVLRIAPGDSNNYQISGGSHAIMESVDQIMEFYNHPGRGYILEFIFMHPSQSIPAVGCYIPNTRHRANYQDYLVHAPDYQAFVDGLLGSPDNLIIPEGLIIPAQAIKFIDTSDGLSKLNYWSPPGS